MRPSVHVSWGAFRLLLHLHLLRHFWIRCLRLFIVRIRLLFILLNRWRRLIRLCLIGPISFLILLVSLLIVLIEFGRRLRWAGLLLLLIPLPYTLINLVGQ